MRRVESIFSMAGVSYEVTMLNVERSTFSEAGLSCESAAGTRKDITQRLGGGMRGLDEGGEAWEAARQRG